MIEVGGYRFKDCNVAFHFQRENVYWPWWCIGVYVTAPGFYQCKYIDEWQYLEDDFNKNISEVDSEYIKAGPEYLNHWRSFYQHPLSVISPVINYYTTEITEYREVLGGLFTRYAGNLSPVIFRMLTVMLKMKDAYFATIFKDDSKREHVIKALKEASLL